MGNGARPAPAAGCPIKHPGRDLKPTIAGSARQAAAANLSATLVDYLMNMDYASGPSMPRISKLALLGPVGLPSSRCTTLADRTARSVIWRRRRSPRQASSRCNGARRCATREASRLAPLLHRPRQGQML